MGALAGCDARRRSRRMAIPCKRPATRQRARQRGQNVRVIVSRLLKFRTSNSQQRHANHPRSGISASVTVLALLNFLLICKPWITNKKLFEIIQSEEFKRWRTGLKDRQAVLRINARIGRMADGNMGDVKPARDGVSELSIDYGPGYRVSGSTTWARTRDTRINSPLLYQLSYRGIERSQSY